MMNKREFLKTSGVLALGAVVAGCHNKIVTNPNENEVKAEDKARAAQGAVTPFEMPKLEYAVDALVPVIDKMTVEIHYGKHHVGYCTKLNDALKTSAHAGKSLENILKDISKDAGDVVLRNNAGGYYNHNLYWRTITSPNNLPKKAPEGNLLAAINGSFGNLETLLTKLKDAAMSQFGSGWAWLCLTADKKLAVTQTPNQDNPLMSNIATALGTPILGIDVWEHAYYLNYQNKRKDYVEAFLSIVDWGKVAMELDKAGK